MSVKLLTYDVYRSGMTLFKDLADQTYQDKEHLPEYFLRKVAQSEVPAGFDAAYKLVYRVAGDPHEHVNGDTIGIMGSQGGGVIQVYIVGETPLDSDWFSDVPGGQPIIPTKEFLYLILTPGNMYNCFYRYNDSTDKYVKVLEATGDGAIFSYEVYGKTPLDSDWLTDTSGGAPITPKTGLMYLVVSAGKFQNRLYRYDPVTTKYVPVSGSGSGVVFSYEVTGKTPLASDWLTDEPGGSSITPDPDLLYLDVTVGKYENYIFRYNSTLLQYVPISGGGGNGAVYTYIVGSTPYASDWLSDSVGGTAITPEEGPLYLVLTAGQHYSAFYRYDETNHVYLLVGNARVEDILKSDYLNLPAAKQNDGTIFFITDSAASAPTKDDYVPARVTAPENPLTGTVMLWKGAVGGDFDISPAFYRYNGTHWVRDNLGIEGQTIQVDVMPVPIASLENKVVQYIGASGNGYVHNFFYECLNVSGTYTWVNTKVQAGDEFQVTSMPAASVDLLGKVYQFLGTTTSTYIHNFFYECKTDGSSYFWENVKVQPGEKTQFDVMPTASAEYAGKVYQYIGVTDSTYTHNCFYECIDNSGTYSWEIARVEIPETKTMSMADFDLLPVTEKNNGQAYFIPDATTEVSYAVRTGFTPVGTVISILGVTPPRLYILCDGSVLNISDYQNLADYFERQFGSVNYFGGDGVTTFAVPNLLGVPEDTIYCIATRDIYVEARLDFDTTEKIVGLWIDNKPIYQKTFITELPQVTTDGTMASRFIDTGTTVSSFVSLRAVRYDPDDDTQCDLPYATFADFLYQMFVRAKTDDASANANKLELCSNAVAWNGSVVYITAQYTKTTD